jgi:hypothetical protein
MRDATNIKAGKEEKKTLSMILKIDRLIGPPLWPQAVDSLTGMCIQVLRTSQVDQGKVPMPGCTAAFVKVGANRLMKSNKRLPRVS